VGGGGRRQAAALVAATSLLVGACSVFGDGDEDGARVAADAYLTAFAAGDVDAMAAVVADPPADFATVQRQFRTALQVVAVEATTGAVEASGATAQAGFEVTLRLQGVGLWHYEGRLDLERVDGDWRVAWTPAALHPALVEGATIRRIRTQGLRAPIVAAGGQALAVGGPGEGSRLDEVAGSVIGQLRTLSAPEATGRGLSYAAGDLVGDSGIESGYEDRLAGPPQGRIEVVDTRGAVLEVVHTFGGERPAPLPVSLDLFIQSAAERAVADVALPVALVAVDSRTGAVRAVANNPPGFDRALLGEYPPGSTFKIVTASALLAAGLTPDATVDCPGEVRPGGSAPFVNAFGEDLGMITFEEAFAESCNTAFVAQGFALGGARLQEAAEWFGFNQAYQVGLPLVLAEFPLPETDTEIGAASIGQGRVTVTPLHMATVAAAAVDGTWRPPYLVGDPPTSGSHVLPEAVAANLPELLREVVRSGTGVEAAVPGRDVGGKTGTAEFGEEDPPETHAWFAGFVDDLAFAVVVEGGGVGGEVAAPIVRQFITQLPPG
jgi:Penicillin binding protein transpeptidase domain/NTF2-like N-terminal transpeptidase domain/Penicillin-binding Protein dimerisation domain